MAVFLQMLCSTVIVRLNCESSVISSFCLCTAVYRLSVLNLPLNERQSLVQAKQGVCAITNDDNFCRGAKKNPPT